MPGTNTSSYSFAATCTLLALVACGDSSTVGDDATPTKAGVTASKAQTVNLPLEPISLAEAYAPLTAVPKAVPECPWLSDASANAAVDDVLNDEPMARRSVTPNECKWNVNIGFAFTIRSVDLAEGISPGSVTYNIDTASVLEPQDGPGSDAVAILDPTWDAENPRPFGFAFNADNRQFRITATGVRTSIDRLRAVADEIFAALPTAAPVVAMSDAEPTLDPCVYTEDVVVALFGGQPGDAITQQPNLPTSSCNYKGYAGDTRIDLTIGFNGDPLDPPNNMDPEYALLDNIGADVYVKDTSRTAGYGSSRRTYQIARPGGHIRIDMTVSEEIFPDTVAESLLNNLIARTN